MIYNYPKDYNVHLKLLFVRVENLYNDIICGLEVFFSINETGNEESPRIFKVIAIICLVAVGFFHVVKFSVLGICALIAFLWDHSVVTFISLVILAIIWIPVGKKGILKKDETIVSNKVVEHNLDKELQLFRRDLDL